MYGKIWYDEDVHDLETIETEFSVIVFNDNLTSNETLFCEPTVSSLNNKEIDFRISFDESDDEDYTVEGYIEEIVHDFEQRLVNQVHTLDFEGLTPNMRQDLAERLRMVYTGDDRHEYLFRHVEGRKSDARLSGGHLIGRFAYHFSLVSDDGLRGLSVVTHELPLIDMGELVKFKICMEIGDGWAWVAQGVERQPVATAATPVGAEDASDVDEGAQAILAPIHIPPPPPAAGRAICMTQLMKASRRTYQAFDGTFRGSYLTVFERRTRCRTDGASTSTTQ
nr:hypothetical protein [Tanacetum cinerariifolium]